MDTLPKTCYTTILRMHMAKNIIRLFILLIFLSVTSIFLANQNLDTPSALGFAIPLISFPLIFVINSSYSGFLIKKTIGKFVFKPSKIREMELHLAQENEFDNVINIANFDLKIMINLILITWIWAAASAALNITFLITEDNFTMGYYLIPYAILNALIVHFISKPNIYYLKYKFLLNQTMNSAFDNEFMTKAYINKIMLRTFTKNDKI